MWRWLAAIVKMYGHRGHGWFALCRECKAQMMGFGFSEGYCSNRCRYFSDEGDGGL